MRLGLACCTVLTLLWPARPAVAAEAPPPAGVGEARHEGAAPEKAKKPKERAKVPYPVNHDAPLDAADAVAEEAKDYTKLRVEFNGIRGDRVPGFLYLPKNGARANAAKKHPAVLLQYGTGGSKTTNYIVALGQQFVAKGFVVLTIDAPHKGERKPKTAQGWKSVFGEKGRFQWYLGDYSRAVDYLLTRPEVDPGRVGYAGISWGAITGVTFVAHEPRVKAMASIVGGGNFMGTMRVEMPPEVVAISKLIDPVYHVALIAPRPLMLLNVTNDQLVPRFFAESLHKAAGENAKKVWVETDHFFRGIDRYAVLDTVIEFMADALEKQARMEAQAGEAAGRAAGAPDDAGEDE